MNRPEDCKQPLTSNNELDNALGRVDQMLRAHGGGVELVRHEGNCAVVRFTGMCRGCLFRPITMEATVRTVLSQVPGIDTVTAEGVRISAEATQRLRSQLSEENRNFWLKFQPRS